MEYRQLGSTGLRVSTLGLGCNNLGWPAPGRTRADMIRLLEYAAEAGVTFYDTADVYVAGESERLLGEVFGRGERRVVIATKVGSTRPLPVRVAPWTLRVFRSLRRRWPWVRRSSAALVGHNFSPGYLRVAVERSLKRLRTDCIDLLQLHSPPPSAVERDDAFAALEGLRSAGAIRFYGIAFGDSPQSIAWPERAAVSTLQIPISAGDGRRSQAALDWARARGIGVIANQPFGKGRLLRAAPAGQASALLCALIQVTGVSTVLAGTTSLDHLKENLAAAEGPP